MLTLIMFSGFSLAACVAAAALLLPVREELLSRNDQSAPNEARVAE